MRATQNVLFQRLKKNFVGVRTLDDQARISFKEEMLETTRFRTQIILCLVILVQIANLVIITFTDLYSGYELAYWAGFAWLSVIGVVYIFLFSRSSMREGSYKARSFAVKSCWFFIVAGNMFFHYIRFIENKSLIDYTAIVVALAIAPAMSLIEIFTIMLLNMGGALVIGIYAELPSNLLLQIIWFGALGLYVAQMRIAASINVFCKQRRLMELNTALERLAETDQLTGLLNRRGLDKNMKILIGLLRRTGKNICMLMLDIDYFKHYNDKFLHIAGDECLSRVANRLKQGARRSSDVVARYGGEEFVLVVQNMTDEELKAYALQIKNSVEAMRIEFGYGDDFPFITVSIGVAKSEIEKSGSDEEAFFQNLLRIADKELYHAKASGRNCISFMGDIYR